jgi:hypothetical protein
MLGIIVDSAANLAAETPFPDVLHQQRTGPVFLAEHLMEIFEYVETYIEAN